MRYTTSAMPLLRELRALLALAGPIILTQIGQMLLGVVDAAYAGHLSVHALDAVTLGNLWQTGTLLPVYGVVIGLDPLVSQAHGAGKGDDAALALQRAILIALGLSLPVLFAWTFTEQGLLLCGQEKALAHAAAVYTHAQRFSAPGFLIYGALTIYLTSRGIVRPTVIAMVLANLFNAFVAYALIFGKFGFPSWGIWGGGLATGLTRMLLPLLMTALIIVLRLHRGAWTPWGARAFERRPLLRQLQLGLPVGVTLSLEMWAFQMGTLIAGKIGVAALAAHSIAINLASLSFMVPLGLAIGASARVGNLIGAREPEHAQRAALTALKLAFGCALCSGGIFLFGRTLLPRIYATDLTTIAAAAAVLPIAAAFQVMDALQAVGGGVLRGMGTPRIQAVLNLIGYYALGIPLAYYLGLHTPLGLRGVWLGYAAGLSVVAAGVVLSIVVRGPRTVRPLLDPS